MFNLLPNEWIPPTTSQTRHPVSTSINTKPTTIPCRRRCKSEQRHPSDWRGVRTRKQSTMRATSPPERPEAASWLAKTSRRRAGKTSDRQWKGEKAERGGEECRPQAQLEGAQEESKQRLTGKMDPGHGEGLSAKLGNLSKRQQRGSESSTASKGQNQLYLRGKNP